MPDDPAVIRLAHSPDPDDAFMWWPLFEVDGRAPRLETPGFRFEPVQVDIETLNERSETAEYELTAVSCAQYPRIRGRYAITSCGASMGDRYGPKLVAREPLRVDDLKGQEVVVAVPGRRTSAFTAASLLIGPGTFRWEAVDFAEIIERVAGGEFAAGLVIHEGQLTYEQAGLHLVEDVGAWWSRTHGLPMPLGLNVIRRDLEDRHGPGTLELITAKLLESVEYALAHREESIAYALRFARGLSVALADEFVGLYVNRWTLDFGRVGREAVRRFLGEAQRAGLVPDPGRIDFITPGRAASTA